MLQLIPLGGQIRYIKLNTSHSEVFIEIKEALLSQAIDCSKTVKTLARPALQINNSPDFACSSKTNCFSKQFLKIFDSPSPTPSYPYLASKSSF